MEAYPKSARSTWIYEDLMPEIFKRLPVKSLCRFRCVCKSWNSLITSSCLVNLHHSFTSSSSSTPPHLKPYLRLPYFRCTGDCYDSYCICFPPAVSNTNLKSGHPAHYIHFPFEFGKDITRKEAKFDFTFVDVVRGVVCLSSTVGSTYDYTLLWNPTIHKFLRIPHRPIPSHVQAPARDFWFGSHAIGFGYDTCKKDFKVVRLFLPDTDFYSRCISVEPTYEVYSLREGLWRAAIAPVVQPCFLCSTSTRTGCFLNGTIHWVVTRSDYCNPYVLMFECEREEFTTVELPEEISPPGSRCFMIELFEYGGMLSAVVKPSKVDASLVDVWAMVEYSSWKKLFRVHTWNNINHIELYQPWLSLDKLATYGPTQWADILDQPMRRFEHVLSHRVYDETMFLMDDAKAESYTENEILSIKFTLKDEIVSIRILAQPNLLCEALDFITYVIALKYLELMYNFAEISVRNPK